MSAPKREPSLLSNEIRTLTVTALAAGGDGVARDDGRVTFVPRTAPGDVVRVRLVQQTKSFARGQLVEIVTPSSARVAPPCPAFERGCGGCAWMHVSRAEQLAAKQAVVAGALRKLVGATLHPIADPAPALGWRRRARFHVQGGRVGLYRENSNDVLAIDACPQLEPVLDEKLREVSKGDVGRGESEVVMLRGYRGDVVVGFGARKADDPVIEIEPGLWGTAWDFAQASEAGNAKLIEIARAALGPGSGAQLLELYAGAGNLTRGFIADGWSVLASDVVAPQRAPDVDAKQLEYRTGAAADIVQRVVGEQRAFDGVVLDPPRAGAAEAIDGIIAISPRVIVYVSCDPATLARDAERLVAAGYRATDAWPVDLMPQTSHVEVVLRLERA
ncbi:MAG TPA: TRAM domain-containing protein [Kofleriaceae bacterium]|jgi:23S rRNA (uracil1939-C5)-methyltransferase